MNTYPPNNQIPIIPVQPQTRTIQTLAILGMAFLILLAIVYAYPLKETSNTYDFNIVHSQVTINENNTLTVFFDNPGLYNIEIHYKDSGVGMNFNVSNASLPVYVDISSIITEKNVDLAIKITLIPDEIWEEKTVRL